MIGKTTSANIRRCLAALMLIASVFGAVSAGFCAPVALETARRVAEAKMHRHMALYGHWNGASTPEIVDWQAIRYHDNDVAYDFKVRPSGHILVAVDDDLAPVPLYSTRADFNPQRTDNPNAIESWIVPELGGKVGLLKENRSRAVAGLGRLDASAGHARIKAAWGYFKEQSVADTESSTLTRSESSTASAASSVARGAVVNALVETRWDQDYPYNSQTPEDGCYDSYSMPTDNTLTGCVATAWAQVLRYYQWPDSLSSTDLGSHSYTWNDQTISVDFSDPKAYDWANMPDFTVDFVTDAQKQAVGWLMRYAGVAAETVYSCPVSSSDIWASDVLDVFFRYKAMDLYQRGVTALPDGKTWFQMFTSELDAGRLVIFTIFSQRGGHEVVVDGYQDDTTEMVHINFGWSGESDDFYDITDDASFNTQYDDWNPLNQYIVVGIEPNRNSELPAVTITSADQTVDEESLVHLTGTASHSSLAIVAYQWLNVGIPSTKKLTAFTNGNTQEATFTAPSVSQDTNYVFMLKAVDAEKGVGYAECTITVRDTGGSLPPAKPPSSSSRSSSGGCFIDALTVYYTDN